MDRDSVKQKMDHAISTLSSDLGSLRTGRAAPSMVENIEVAAYGGAQKLKIQELASINSTDPQSLIIDPWDKSVIGEIKKGIESANVGLNPQIDGEVIRINVLQMTQEDRQKYVKLLGAKIESGRVMVRQIRAEAMKGIKNQFEKKEIPEDEKFRLEKELQKLTDEFTEKIEEMSKAKEKELLSV